MIYLNEKSVKQQQQQQKYEDVLKIAQYFLSVLWAIQFVLKLVRENSVLLVVCGKFWITFTTYNVDNDAYRKIIIHFQSTGLWSSEPIMGFSP